MWDECGANCPRISAGIKAVTLSFSLKSLKFSQKFLKNTKSTLQRRLAQANQKFRSTK
jgi:hypothetical protein